jgi:hypothetical protein
MSIRKYPRFADDMRHLDNLATAYQTCTTDFRSVWKQKWYEMVELIAKRVSEWEKNEDKSNVH